MLCGKIEKDTLLCLKGVNKSLPLCPEDKKKFAFCLTFTPIHLLCSLIQAWSISQCSLIHAYEASAEWLLILSLWQASIGVWCPTAFPKTMQGNLCLSAYLGWYQICDCFSQLCFVQECWIKHEKTRTLCERIWTTQVLWERKHLCQHQPQVQHLASHESCSIQIWVLFFSVVSSIQLKYKLMYILSCPLPITARCDRTLIMLVSSSLSFLSLSFSLFLSLSHTHAHTHTIIHVG